MKNKITYLATILKDYAQNKEQLKQTEVINKLIVEKLKNMEKEMKRMKEYICQNEKIVYGNIEFKNKIFDSYIQLEEFNKKAQKTSEIILE